MLCAKRVSVAEFLSIQAQDFIEETWPRSWVKCRTVFLSIQAQDFIEETPSRRSQPMSDYRFLSIQAQDFIEDRATYFRQRTFYHS